MTGIILQARMNSTRLPGKILMPLGNKSLIDHIFYRLSFLKNKVKIILATTDTAKDDKTAEYCIQKNISCFRGSEYNVLERYYLCAKHFELKNIIRLTGDNPFPDIEELDKLIGFFHEGEFDYANSFSVLPVGIGAEIFTFRALEKSYQEGKEPHHLEHVNEYMLENPDIFKTGILRVPASKMHPEIRLTIDTLEDFKKAELIVNSSNKKFITTEEAITFCLLSA